MNREELHPLLRRAMLFLESGDKANADDYCEKYLDLEPEGAWAYIIKLMIRVGVTRVEDLATAQCSFRDWDSFKKAYHFADEELKARLLGYLQAVEERIQRQKQERQEQERKAVFESKYLCATRDQRSFDVFCVQNALNTFIEIAGYKDSAERIVQCRERLAYLEEIRAKAEKDTKRRRIVTTCIVLGILTAIIISVSLVSNATKETRVPEIEKNLAGSYSASYMDGHIYDGGGVISAYDSITEYDVTYVFREGHTGTINSVIYHDEEPFLIVNGQREWDSVERTTGTFTWGDIDISLTGKVTVMINGNMRCEVTLDDNDRPQAIEIDGHTYRVRK